MPFAKRGQAFFVMGLRTSTLQQALDHFMLDAQAKRLAASTLIYYRARLTLFFGWCEGQQLSRVADVTTQDLRRFFVYLQEQGYSSHYQHGIARAVRRFFNFCTEEGIIDQSPMQRVPMPKVDKKVLPALTSQEVTRVLGKCYSERDKAIVLLLLDSGLRVSEMTALNTDDIDMTTGVVTVRKGKGGKGRVTQIGARTRKQLSRYYLDRNQGPPKKGKSGPVFFSQRGRRLKLDAVVKFMTRLSERSGVHVTAHKLRRTFAINCLRNGMSEHVLAKLMGHADLAVLKQYLDFTGDDLRSAHDDAGPVDNLL